MQIKLQPIQPQFILESELNEYGLPDVATEPKILSYVRSASTLIDQHCGYVTKNGWGSMVWTTYGERLYLSPQRNMARVSYKPMLAADTVDFTTYGASGSLNFGVYGASGSTNLLAPNTENGQNGALSPFLYISGRYGYGRRASQQVYPDLNYGANILQIASYFGGPPNWTPIAISNTDYDDLTGEFWVPAGLFLSAYTEVFVMYNAGFPPNILPTQVKRICALLVQNYMSRPAPGMNSFGVGTIHHEFTPNMIDETLDDALNPFKNAIAM